MAKMPHQKLKMIYIRDILMENTDDLHYMTIQDIIQKLKEYGIDAEKKSVCDDIECLMTYGVDIIKEKKGRYFVYYVGTRNFELPELKLLVDAVQSSKFITTKKSDDLIKKLESFVSVYDAKQLQRQVYVTGRVKNMNESIYINVDAIHHAIAKRSKIKFQYLQWNEKKELKPKKNGEYYEVSPWSLIWDNGYYYLVAYENTTNKIKHYRVDKMKNIYELNKGREGEREYKKIDSATYAEKMFSMYGGSMESVQIECENNLAGAIIDRFGKNVSIIKKDDKSFFVNAYVAVSMHFIHWIMALGQGAKIIAPDYVVEMTRNEIDRMMNQYK